MQTQGHPACPGLHSFSSSSSSSLPCLLFCRASCINTKTILPHQQSNSVKYNSSSSAAVIRRRCSPTIDSTPLLSGDDGEEEEEEEERFDFEIQVTGDNSRRIRSMIAVNASLQTVWDILTDYEKLPDIIPSLASCKLIEKRGNTARLFQIGEQKLAFGLNFSAKGLIDCFEKDFESTPHRLRREIDFKMVKGDFQLFEGKWSIEQYQLERCEGSDQLVVFQECRTTLSYLVDVEPKRWLPVGLVQGRICKEIKMNLACIKLEAEKRRR